MSRIKSKNTAPELILRKRLWAAGFRYRKDVKTLPGKPDVVFSMARIAVFIDGRFWHGKKLTVERLGRMSPYWQEKISKNVARDVANSQALSEMGYLVLRFTDVEVTRDPVGVVNQVRDHLARRGGKKTSKHKTSDPTICP